MTLYQRPQVLHSCLVLLVTLWSNKFEKKSLYLSYTFWSYSITKGRQGRNWGQWSRDRNWRRPWMNISSLLTSQGLLSLLTYTFHDHLPKCGTGHSELGPLKSILNQANVHRHVYCQCDRDSFSIYIPTFQLILSCVDKTKQQNQSIKHTNKNKVIQPLHPFLWLYYQALFSPDLDILHAWGTYKQIRYSCTNFYDFIIYGFCLCKYLLENKDQ